MEQFIEVTFRLSREGTDTLGWNNCSTPEYFVFQSSLGTVRLKKRTSFPKTFCYVKNSNVFFGYGDSTRVEGLLDKELTQLPESVFYGEEFLVGSANSLTGSLILQRDALCTLPLFAATTKECLYLSNNCEQAYAFAQKNKIRIKPTGLAALIAGNPMTSISLIEDVDVLVDRARVTLNEGHYQREFPPNGSIVNVVQDRNGDPRLFREKLEDSIESHWNRYSQNNKVALELSGGLDSSCIAGNLSINDREFASVSLTFADSYNKELIELKLAALQRNFGLISLRVPMSVKEDFPLKKVVALKDPTPFYHGEIIYRSSFEKLARILVQQGCSAVFQGHGGDELFENIPRYDHQDFSSPLFVDSLLHLPSYTTMEYRRSTADLAKSLRQESVALLANSTATESAGANNVYLEQGIWPVKPLADPQLYLYCQSLPIQYRSNRNIMRAYLEARGFSEVIYNPVDSESFTPFLNEAVHFGLFDYFKTLMCNSVLGDLKIIDPFLAIQTWEKTAANFSQGENVFSLYCLLIAEMNVRTLLG